MLQLSTFKHVALAMVLGMTALIGSAGHVFAQEPAGSVVLPNTVTTAPDAAVILPPAGGPQAIFVENGGALSVVVLPATDASLVAPAVSSAIVPSYDPPLGDVVTPYSPLSTSRPWELSAPGSTNVLSSDDPPLDNPTATGAPFPNNPWKG